MSIFDLFRSPYQDPKPPPSAAKLNAVERAHAMTDSRAQSRTILDMDMGSDTISDMLLRSQGIRTNPWRAASIREALGVPAIFRAVSLIATTTGSVAMEAYRKGVRLEDDETPALVKRPNPLTIPRDFYRDTAFYLASRGEYWWWVAKRDGDGNAMSLVCVPPWEVTVELNQKDRLRPKIVWLDKERDPRDMRHGTFLPDSSGLRGVGPLQMCGAAISVSVEAQEWAANFFASGNSDLLIKVAGMLGEGEDGVQEADTLKEQWMEKTSNTPRVVDEAIDEVKYLNPNVNGAAMLDSREYQNGDAARMFGISGSLLEYTTPGSNLTYQNLEQEFTKFIRTCLAPGYLEPIEQEMSDLLPRSTVARFNVRGFMRADIKTRFEVYKLAADVLPPEEAAEYLRQSEGLVPGDVEYAPVPMAPPAAVPAPIAMRTEMVEVRCDGRRMMKGILRPCNRLLTKSGEFVGRCPRCGKDQNIAVRVDTPAPIIPIAPRLPAKRTVEPPPAPEPEVSMRDLLERLPGAIAAAMPRTEPTPIVQIAEGAFRSDLHMPPTPRVSKRIERDGTGYIVTEE